jgi:DNA-binding transcriptional ArsR family regulator
VSEDADVAVLGLLDDRYARAILTATSDEPMSAKQLGEACDASLSTVYRRVDDLEDHGLLAERTRVDADGHHRTLYRSLVESVRVDFDDGVRVSVVGRHDPADRIAGIWDGMREGDE